MKAHLSLEWRASLVSFAQDKCSSGKKGEGDDLQKPLREKKEMMTCQKNDFSGHFVGYICQYSNADHGPQILKKQFFCCLRNLINLIQQIHFHQFTQII